MFTPTRIEVRNVGSIPHAVVEPHSTGITVLDGGIGTGKSSFLNAIPWCLFGYIGGVESFTQQQDMRFDQAPEGEPVEVAVEFDWGGQAYRAVRRLKRSKAGAEKAEAALSIDGVQQKNMSPDRLTEKMVSLTGLTGKAFTSAFFIPQHHLVRLAEGKPAEVQSVIEEQTGLTGLTKLIQTARQEALAAQQQADVLPGSPETLDAAQQVVDEAQAVAAEVFERVVTCRARAERSKGVQEETTSVLDRLMDAQRRAEQATQRLLAARARMDAQTDVLAAAESALESVGEPVDVSGLDAEQRQLNTLVAAVAAAIQGEEQAHARLRDAEAAAQQVSAPETAVQVWQERVEQARGERASAEALAEAKRGEWTSAKQRQDALLAGRGTCPTCLQQVSDPVHVKAEFAALLTQIAADGQTAKDAAEKAAETLRAAENGAAQAARQQQQADAAEQRLIAIAFDCEQAVHRRVTAFSALAAAGHDTVESAETRLGQIGQLSAVAARQEQARMQHQRAEQAASAAKTELDAAEQAAATTGAPEADEVFAARQAETMARADADTDRAALAVATAESEQHRATVEAAERVRDQARADLDAKIGALDRVDTLRHAVAALAEQRTDLLTMYTEVISEAASRVMESAGGGRHVAVVIDNRFTPEVVLADGRRRPFRLCSGGEKLRAALALALGQVELMSGGNTTGMLMADEIATGYDQATTRAVMDVIAALNRPMMLIGHNPEVPQIANRVYEFSNPDDTGTIVTLAGAAAFPQQVAA